MDRSIKASGAPAPAATGRTSTTTDVGFDRTAELERVWLDDASWVDVGRGWLRGAEEVFEAARTEVAWKTSELFRYDHRVEERRLGAAWRPGQAAPHPALVEVHRHLRHRYAANFPGFTMIQYRDGSDGQAFHRDTDMRWLESCVIAILTLGAQRPWLIRPHSDRFNHEPGKGATHDFSPAAGDLLVMGGRCQVDWQHSVPYLPPSQEMTPRISLQWRYAKKVGRPFQGASYRAPRRFGPSRG